MKLKLRFRHVRRVGGIDGVHAIPHAERKVEGGMTKGGTVGKLAAAIRAGGGVCMAWVGNNDPSVAEVLARSGFDAVLLDMQHGAVDVAGAIRAITACFGAGVPTVVRIPVGDFATASRMIDAGAAGVIAPMINSVEDARRFADFMKYPPLGGRSWGPRSALPFSGLDGKDYLAAANDFTLAIAMIETREALDALDGILGTAGIDGVFVGPSDLSIALSRGASVEPRGSAVAAAVDRVVERARSHDKFASLFCFDGDDARAAHERGIALHSVSTDQLLLRGAAQAELAKARVR